MLLVYDHDNVLHITNEKGLRWNYDRADKPQFGFDYDHLFFVPHDDMFEFELNGETEPLNEEAQEEVAEYIRLCEPPLELTMRKQYIEDLQEEVRLKKELMAYEFELNQKLRGEERSQAMGVEKMKEDGKDRRENIKQTSKKFESSGNDILGGGMGLDKFNPQIGN